MNRMLQEYGDEVLFASFRQQIMTFLKELFPCGLWDRVWLVGGGVRDLLLGRSIRDIDLLAAVSPAVLDSLGFRLVLGKSTPPVYFRSDPVWGGIELVRLTGSGDLLADLGRRDFTANALALSLAGEFVDPFGGSRDVRRRILRACSRKTFHDDPLRIFRAFRFEAEGWRLAAKTEAVILENSWDESLAGIPAERFSREMMRALAGAEPERFFIRMLESRTGFSYLPELPLMKTIPAGPPNGHPEGDLLAHSLQVLKEVAARSGDPLARFCAFFHDLGKLITSPSLYPHHRDHGEAGFMFAADLCDRLRLPGRYRSALMWVSRLHGRVNCWQNLGDPFKLQTVRQAQRAGIADVLPMIAGADSSGGRDVRGWDCAVQVVNLSCRELGITPEIMVNTAVAQRADVILQARVKLYRELISAGSP